MTDDGIDLSKLSVRALERLRDWYAETIRRTGTDRSYERAIAAIDAVLAARGLHRKVEPETNQR